MLLSGLFFVATALPLGGIRNSIVKRKPSKRRSQESSLFVTQDIDHFDRTSTRTFQQRYFANATYYKAGGPVFLCVGGEGPALDDTVLYNSVHCSDMTELAPRAGAMMLAIEHRYYGSSVPDKLAGETTTSHLRFLSTEQAIADIAVFHQLMVAQYNLTDAKWVTFGGSYPGMVSGMARLKLPHLIWASVSSSAPWQAKVDMQEYNDVAGNALSLASVGGSAECQTVVVQGHEDIKTILDSNNATAIAALAETFDFCNPDTALGSDEAKKDWAGYGVIEIPAQENDPADTTPGANIESICAILTSTNDSYIERLAQLSSVQNSGCLRSAAPAAMMAPGALLGSSDAYSWPWQTCTEYGYYQTCEVDSSCPYAKGYVTLEDEMSMCQSLFNISAAQVSANIDFSNAIWGGGSPKPSRIYFPNGDVDPWSGLGVNPSPDDNTTEKVLIVSGASHHAWTHPADTIVQQSVADAKLIIQNQVMAWLAEPY